MTQQFVMIKMILTEKKSRTLLKSIKILGKVILLTFIFMIVTGIASGIAGLDSASLVENASQVMGITLLVFFLQTITLSFPVLRSNLRSLHLVVLVALLYFGISVFLVQIETLVFLNYFTGIISPEIIQQLFIQGGVTSVIFAPIVVFVLRGRRSGLEQRLQSIRFGMSKLQGLAKVSVLALIFVLFYVFFGALVAWQNPALSEFYGSDLIAKLAQVGGLMLLLQAGRGIVFIALAIPVIRTSNGKTWEKALMIGLLFCILTASNLLIPSTLMPEAVRLTQFYEVAIPGFIFGVLVVWLMQRSHTSVLDLFRGQTKDVHETIEVIQPPTPLAY
jgi:hypothetical protein